MNPHDALMMSLTAVSQPYSRGVACTANVAFPLCRCINSATAQSVTVTWDDNTTSTLLLQAGHNPYAVKKVSATGIVALY